MTKQYTLKILTAAGLTLMAAFASTAGTDCRQTQAKEHPCCADPIEQSRSRAWLGIEKRIEANGTYIVTAVFPDSPASRADLRVGDIIERIDGIRLTAGTASGDLPSRSMIGRTIPIKVRRGADQLILFAKIAEIPKTGLGSLREEHRRLHTAN
jgi:C-terminal processing protease CtpA/Prc